MRVEIVPATPADFAALAERSESTPRAPPMRVVALAAKVEGRVVGIGGIAFYKNGQNVAFADITDEARKYGPAIHRAGRAAISLAKSRGIKRLVAIGESNPASSRWLIRLGFRPVDIDGVRNYVLDL